MSKAIPFILGVSLFVTLTVTASDAGNGAEIFKRQCGTCHSIKVNGSRYGKGYMNVDLTGITGEYGDEYVRMYIQDPEKARQKYSKRFEEIKENYEGKMPPVNLDDDQLKELIEFLNSK